MKPESYIIIAVLLMTTIVNTAFADSALNHFDKGHDYFQMGKYSIAIDYFDKAIAMSADKYLFYEFRGNAKHQSKDYTGAIADYNTAIGLCSYCFTIYMARSESKRALGDKAGADADMKQATRLKESGVNPVIKHLDERIDKLRTEDPQKLGRGILARAEIKYRDGDWAGALEDYNSAGGTGITKK